MKFYDERVPTKQFETLQFNLKDKRILKLKIFFEENFTGTDLILKDRESFHNSDLLKDEFGNAILKNLQSCQIGFLWVSINSMKRSCLLIQNETVFIFSESTSFFNHFYKIWSKKSLLDTFIL